MADFDVKPARLYIEKGQLEFLAPRVNYIGSNLNTISANLNWCSSMEGIRIRINNEITNIGAEANNARRLCESLGLILKDYVDTENRILTNVGVPGYTPNNLNLLWNIVMQAGMAGGFFGGLGMWVHGLIIGDSYAAWNGLARGVGYFVGDAIQAGNPVKAGWSVGDWFGTSVDPSLKPFKGKAGKEIPRLEAAGAGASGALVSTLTSPAAWITSAIDRGFQNYGEWKSGSIDEGRAVDEFVLETGVAVGELALATAGVAAVLAATGIGAPVVVVGAVAAVAVWGADCLCEYVTGKIWGQENAKDIPELISDAVLDTKEYVKGKVDEIVDKYLGDEIGAAKNAVTETLSAGWNSICGVFA